MLKKNGFLGVFLNGLIFENPVFVLMLGMCPTLAITITGMSGLVMGLATTAVLVCSNLIISALRNVIPDKVRIPAYIVIIASFVTMVDLFMQAYMDQQLMQEMKLGMYIPLIVVNCIIFARAESFASKNPVHLSLADGMGMGLGFTVALTALSCIRELFGSGTIFGAAVMPASYQPMTIMLQVPGGFVTLGLLLLIINAVRKALSKKNVKKEAAA